MGFWKRLFSKDISFEELRVIYNHMKNLQIICKYDPDKDNELRNETRFIKVVIGIATLANLLEEPGNRNKSLKSLVSSGNISQDQKKRIIAMIDYLNTQKNKIDFVIEKMSNSRIDKFRNGAINARISLRVLEKNLARILSLLNS